MPKTDFKSVDEYQDTFPSEIKERLSAVRQAIRAVAPEAEEVISYQIPAYKYAGSFLIYYSGYKGHLTLSYPYSEALLKAFETALKKYKLSKSAIQFPHTQELPLDLIMEIVQFRLKENLEIAAARKKK